MNTWWFPPPHLDLRPSFSTFVLLVKPLASFPPASDRDLLIRRLLFWKKLATTMSSSSRMVWTLPDGGMLSYAILLPLLFFTQHALSIRMTSNLLIFLIGVCSCRSNVRRKRSVKGALSQCFFGFEPLTQTESKQKKLGNWGRDLFEELPACWSGADVDVTAVEAEKADENEVEEEGADCHMRW